MAWSEPKEITIDGSQASLKINWKEQYNPATLESEVCIDSLYAKANTTYDWSGNFYTDGTIYLTDANDASNSILAVSLKIDSPANNIIDGLKTATWSKILPAGTGFTFTNLKHIKHSPSGEAAFNITIGPNNYENFQYYRAGAALAINEQTISNIALNKHPQGTVYIANGSTWNAYQCYIGNGNSWDLAIPYIGDGASWIQY